MSFALPTFTSISARIRSVKIQDLPPFLLTPFLV
jgi:hypothetical protein